MPVDDPFDRIQPVGDESPVCAGAEVRRQCLEEPEGRVHGAVLGRLAAVGEPIGNQALVEKCHISFEHTPGLPERAGPHRQAGEADHRVAAPVGEPLVAGDNGSLVGRGRDGGMAPDSKLFGGHLQLSRERMYGPRINLRRLSLLRGMQ